MLVLDLHFPAARWHATPWGSHVNEGVVEWPPSPWRLLRALVAVWHLKATNRIHPQLMRRLLHKLASQRPLYELPQSSPGHTRHYMPIISGRTQKTTKVFDTFLQLDAPVRVAWELDLDAEERHALELLCELLVYFGRAESLAEVHVSLGDIPFQPNAWPLPPGQPVPEGSELVRVLCPMTPEEYARWHQQQSTLADESTAPPTQSRHRKPTPKPPPADLFHALHAETGDLQQAGWIVPPGARWVDYVRPTRGLTVAHLHPTTPQETRLTVARFAVSSAVLPRITDAISLAERVHQALLARFKDKGSPPQLLSGRDTAHRPLQGHRHLFIVAEPNGPRDAITHLTLYARDGFDALSRWAVESLRKVWGHGSHDLQLVLLGFGDRDTFEDCPLFQASKVWRSLTPFVPTRHPKTYRDGRPKLDADGWWIGSPEHDLRRLIGEAGLPAPSRIERLQTITIHGRRLKPIEFRTHRYHGQGRRAANALPVAFQLTFSKPVSGPLALGYGAHFGLGLFVPAGG